MEIIKCPYDSVCGFEFEPTRLNDKDYSFLQSAVKKKMTFMFITCPNCSRSFKFDTVKWESEASMKIRNGFQANESKKSPQQLLRVLRDYGVELRKDYVGVLMSPEFEGNSFFKINEVEFLLFSLNELCKEVELDGQIIPQINLVKGYSTTLKEVLKDDLKSSQADELSILSDGIAIGSNNTEILFIDPRDMNALLIFHPDGGDISRTGKKLDELVSILIR